MSSLNLHAAALQVLITISTMHVLGEGTYNVDPRGTTLDFQANEIFLSIIYLLSHKYGALHSYT